MTQDKIYKKYSHTQNEIMLFTSVNTLLFRYNIMMIIFIIIMKPCLCLCLLAAGDSKMKRTLRVSSGIVPESIHLMPESFKDILQRQRREEEAQ